MMGETIPKESNYVALDASQKDPFGIPQLKISIAYDDNDEKMVKDYQEQLTEMFTEAGFKNIRSATITPALVSTFTRWVVYGWVKILKRRC